MKNSPPTLKQGVLRYISPTRDIHLPGEGCFNQDVFPVHLSKQRRQSRRELAGRRAANASWNPLPLAEPTFCLEALLKIPADTTDIAISHLSQLFEFKWPQSTPSQYMWCQLTPF